MPATVLVSAASAPLGAKFGFCFPTGWAVDLVMLDSVVESPVKASCCDGRAAFERLKGLVGLGEGDCWEIRRGEGDLKRDERWRFGRWEFSSHWLLRGLLQSPAEEERRLRWLYASLGLREQESLS